MDPLSPSDSALLARHGSFMLSNVITVAISLLMWGAYNGRVVHSVRSISRPFLLPVCHIRHGRRTDADARKRLEPTSERAEVAKVGVLNIGKRRR